MSGMIFFVSLLVGGLGALLLGRATGVLSGKLALGLCALPLLGVGLGFVFC